MTRDHRERRGLEQSTSRPGGSFGRCRLVRAVADAVREGLLRPRMRLPPWLLYDAQGSALFEDITGLPEYYVTRTERGILASHADDAS